MAEQNKVRIAVEAVLQNYADIIKQVKDAIQKGLVVDGKDLGLDKIEKKLGKATNIFSMGEVPGALKETINYIKQIQTQVLNLFSTISVEAGGASNNLAELTKKLDAAKAAQEKAQQALTTAENRFRVDKTGQAHYSKQYAEQLYKESGGKTALPKTATAYSYAKELLKEGKTNVLSQLGWSVDKEGKLTENLTNVQKAYNDTLEPLKQVVEEANKLVKAVEAQLKEERANVQIPTVEGDPGEKFNPQPLLEANTKAIKNLGTAQEEQAKHNQQVADAAKKANDELEENKTKTEQATDATNKNTNAVSRAVSTFFGYQMVLRQLRKLWNEAIRTVRELDKQLTNQAIVTGMTREETWQLVSTYQDLAAATGLAQTTIAAVTTEYLRQGESLADALTLTKAAAAAATVAGISAQDSVKYLTTAVHGFRLEAEDALGVSDKFAALAAQAATNYEDLAIALSKVASQASLAGMSMDYTLALLTTGLDVTQEAPESIGTALKTIIARMREISDYGKTLEDGIDINQVEDGLAAVGIKLRDTEGELRSTQDVLDELGKKWKDLSKNQQAAVAKALAGTRQQSRLVAILENYDKVLDYQEVAMNSIGATTAQQMTYLTGMEAAINRLQNAYQSLIEQVVNSDAVIGVVNTLTSLLNQLGKFLNTFGGKASFFTLIPTLLLRSKAFTSKIRDDFLAIVNAAKQMTGQFEKSKEESEEIKNNMTSASQGQPSGDKKTTNGRGLRIANGISAAVTGAMMIAGWVQEIVNQAKDGMKEVVSATIEEGNRIQAQIYTNTKTMTTLNSLTKSLSKLDDQVIKSSDDLKEMNDLRTQLIDELGLDPNGRYSNQMLQDRALAETTRLEKENQKLVGELSDTLLKAGGGGNAWQIIGNIAMKTGSGAGVGAMAGSAIPAGWGTAVGAIVGGVAGLVTGIVEESIAAAQRNDAIKQIEELSKTDEGVNQLRTLLNYVYTRQDGLTDEQELNVRSSYAGLISILSGEQINALLKQFDYNATAVSDALNNALANSVDAVNILNDESAKYVDKTAAVVEVYQQMQSVAPELAEAFASMYGTYLSLNDILGPSVALLDEYKWNLSAVNNLINILGEDKAKVAIDALGAALATAGDKTEALTAAVDGWSNEAKLAAAEMISGYTMQDLADLQTSGSNKIKTFRETQAKWSSMSASERRSFIDDNEMFFNIPGAREAWNSGGDISQFLAQYRAGLQEQLSSEIGDKISALILEISAAQAAGDEERVTSLKRNLAELEDQAEEINHMFDLSLTDVVDKQNQQISKLKEMYKEQEEALTESLEKRREAYQKYFDALEQTERIEEYATSRDQIIDAISRVSAGTDANSRNKLRDLQKQLKQLEENEAKNRREEARQAVLENIDDQISQIEEQFDKLLNNNVELLNSMDENTHMQYLAYLASQGKTPEEIKLIEQEMADLLKGRWSATGNDYFGQNAAQITNPSVTTVDTSNNTTSFTVNANGQSETVQLTNTQMRSLLESMFNELTRMTGKTFALAKGV